MTTATVPVTREHAAALDAADPLATFRERFVFDDSDLVYLDGNSLGRLPKVVAERLAHTTVEGWGGRLIRGWADWLDMPERVGDRIAAAVLGAGAGQVIVADSTTVNLYKLAAAALDARPGRRVIVTDRDNFPTDRYVLDGLARSRGLTLRWLAADPVEGPQAADLSAVLDSDVALVSLSHVNYRSAAIADMAAITALAHEAGALTLWDLSHAVGSIPLALDADGVDLAVGCTYKFLNSGPGAPAFLYVRRALQGELRNPIQGWFGQRDQFAMGPAYDPEPGIRRWLTGTPTILALTAVDESVGLVAEAGIEAIRAKSIGLTEYAIALHDAWLASLGFSLGGPRDAERRGAHVAVRHRDARRFNDELIAANVVPDFREPDSIRLGLSPLTTSYTDVWRGMDRLRDIAAR